MNFRKPFSKFPHSIGPSVLGTRLPSSTKLVPAGSIVTRRLPQKRFSDSKNPLPGFPRILTPRREKNHGMELYLGNPDLKSTRACEYQNSNFFYPYPLIMSHSLSLFPAPNTPDYPVVKLIRPKSRQSRCSSMFQNSTRSRRGNTTDWGSAGWSRLFVKHNFDSNREWPLLKTPQSHIVVRAITRETSENISGERCEQKFSSVLSQNLGETVRG